MPSATLKCHDHAPAGPAPHTGPEPQHTAWASVSVCASRLHCFASDAGAAQHGTARGWWLALESVPRGQPASHNETSGHPCHRKPTRSWPLVCHNSATHPGWRQAGSWPRSSRPAMLVHHGQCASATRTSGKHYKGLCPARHTKALLPCGGGWGGRRSTTRDSAVTKQRHQVHLLTREPHLSNIEREVHGFNPLAASGYCTDG